MLYTVKKISKRFPSIDVGINVKSPRISKWSATTNEKPFVNYSSTGSLCILAPLLATINAFRFFLRKSKGTINNFCSSVRRVLIVYLSSMEFILGNVNSDIGPEILLPSESTTKASKSVTIFIDSRQKRNKFNRAIHDGFKQLGVKVVRSKLYVGDYARHDTMRIAVDTKRGPAEIVKNLCSDDRERFKRECLRAKELGVELIILIIDDAITCIDDVHSWVNTRGQIQGPQLSKTMKTWEERYVHFEFCRQEDASEKILDILGVEYEIAG